MTIGTSPHSAPGWRVVGRPFWTCVDLPDHPRDPAIVRALREIEPQAIPMIRKWAYRRPGSNDIVIVAHHAIGRAVPESELRTAHRRFYVEMPPECAHGIPNVIEYVHEDLQDPGLLKTGAPAPYRPFDDELLAILRAKYATGIDLAAWDRAVEAEAEQVQRDAERWSREMAYRDRRIAKLADKVLDEMTSDDWRQFAAMRLAKRQRSRAQGASA